MLKLILKYITSLWLNYDHRIGEVRNVEQKYLYYKTCKMYLCLLKTNIIFYFQRKLAENESTHLKMHTPIKAASYSTTV